MNRKPLSMPPALLGVFSLSMGAIPTPQPKRFGGSYRNHRNFGGCGKRKNPFRGTTYAKIIGVASHI